MNELLREIQEDMRRERAQNLWKSFGKFAVAASVALILATIVIVVWQEHKQGYQTEQTSKFIKGLDRLNLEDYKGAMAAFDSLTDDNSSAYYGLAMLRKAETQMLSGHKDEAQKTYQELAGHDSKGDVQAFASLAKIMASPNADQPIKPVKSSPFYFTQTEWSAWQLLKAGKKKEAADAFALLQDNLDAPSSMRQRASLALQQISPSLPKADKPGHE